jgi:L-fuconolactonase
MIPAIDAHHHLWNYSAEEYAWISEEMRNLRRDFLPADLKPRMDAAGVDGAIAVQARRTAFFAVLWAGSRSPAPM